jgi:hypothetical protein
MNETAITQYITETFPGVDVVVASRESGAPEVAWGDSFFFCGTERTYPMPFATIVTKDYGDFDCASNLNRPGVFRLNIGISKETYRSLFGEAETGHDFAALDQLLPHPVYAAQSWICVLNPSAETFARVRPLLAEAYTLAASRSGKREA